MAALPESQHTTAQAIVWWYESKPQEHRPHMGASLIGHACDRHIWLTWRWALKPEFQGRILRLFSTGQREEPRLLEELRGIGATVWEVDPATGDQWRVQACDGHFGGSLDGVALGLPEGPKTPAVLEFKTHSHKSFGELAAKGGVRQAKPQHFDQMTVYMGLMELSRALYVAVDKDTDELYTEWVQFDRERFDWLLARAQRLIALTAPPDRISADPAHWQCKFCGFHKHCHQGVAAEANCRTCCHASPVANAAWRCEVHGDTIPLDFQRRGCDQHLLIPQLVPYGEPVDGGSNWVAYKHRESGKHFINGPAELHGSSYGPAFTSAELHHCPADVLPDAVDVKAEFPGAKVISGGVTGSAFDDMPSDDLDVVQTKRDVPAVRERRKRVAQSLAQLEALQP